MKKKILVLAAVAAMTITGAFVVQTNIQEAKAVNSECPNGCIRCGDGCYCNGWHECLKEYSWPEDVIKIEVR